MLKADKIFAFEKEGINKIFELKDQKSSNIEDIIHEFKTPITSIIGFVELLQKEKRDKRKTDIK